MTTRFKKAIAAGLIGVTALGATAAVPALASAQAPGDGTELTQEEREARRAERRAAREARRAEKVAVLTDALGVGEDVLQAAREAGQSIADVADANGVSVDSVVTALVDHKAAQIQARVDAGDLTQEEANEKIAGLAERVTERVNATPGERGDGEGRGFGRRGPGGPGGGNAEPASA
ncbi:MAG: hypothetical protein AAF567_08940 [Actinomycetota bacterium]